MENLNMVDFRAQYEFVKAYFFFHYYKYFGPEEH